MFALVLSEFVQPLVYFVFKICYTRPSDARLVRKSRIFFEKILSLIVRRYFYRLLSSCLLETRITF